MLVLHSLTNEDSSRLLTIFIAQSDYFGNGEVEEEEDILTSWLSVFLLLFWDPLLWHLPDQTFESVKRFYSQFSEPKSKIYLK